MSEKKTPEQVVAEAITAYWEDESRSGPNRGPIGRDAECGKAVVAALLAEGMLAVGEPSDERVVAALNASVQEERRQMRMQPISDSDLSRDISDWGPQTAARMRAALTAAAGVAPQESAAVTERDALAAVVEKVREYAEQVGGQPWSWADGHRRKLFSIVDTAPTDVLREHDAKVRAEALREAREAVVSMERAFVTSEWGTVVRKLDVMDALDDRIEREAGKS